MGLQKKTISGIKWTAVSSIVTSILSLVQLAILARLLTPNDFGLMAMVMVAIGFAQVYVDMGMSNAIIYRQTDSYRQLSSLYWLNIATGVIIFFIMIAVSPLIVLFYHEPRLYRLLWLSSCVYLITPIGQQFQILLQRDLKFNLLAVPEIVSSFVGVGVSIWCASAGFGVFSLVWGQLTAALVWSLILAIIGFRDWRPIFHFNVKDLEGYLKFGMYQLGERSINYFGWNLDKLLIGSLLGAQSLGYYNIAYQLMTKPYAILNPIITKVSFPVFAKIQNDNVRLCSGYLHAIRVIALVLFPIYVGLITLASPFFQTLVGQNWMPAVPIFQILCILGFFYSIGNPFGSLLLAKGRADLGFYLNCFLITLYMIAVWQGAVWGLKGIAFGLVFMTAFGLFPVGFYLRWKLVKMRPMEFIQAFLPSLGISILTGLSVEVWKRFMLFFSPFHELITLSTIGILTYFIFLYVGQKKTLIRILKTAGS